MQQLARTVRVVLYAGQVDVSDDAGQHVVEVMRDAARENPQGLQFVHALQLLLKTRRPRDVDTGRDKPRDAPFCIPEQSIVPGDHPFLA